MANTVKLGLPLIASSQAQKHVTANEAFLALDALTQLTVIDKDLTAPPGSPSDGDTYIVGASATGDWATHDDDIAYYYQGAWYFFTPKNGWMGFVSDETKYYSYNSGWVLTSTIIP